MERYLHTALSITDIMDAITAINEGYGLQNIKSEHLDNSQSIESLDILEREILLWLNQISYAHQTFTDPSRSAAVYNYWRDLCDGVAVVKAIVSYRPELISLYKEIVEKPYIDIYQRQHNWEQITEYCKSHLGVIPSFIPHAIADPQVPTIRSNLLVFLCDLFCILVYDEGNVHYEDDLQDTHEEGNTNSFSNSIPSNATTLIENLNRTHKSIHKLRESMQIIRQSMIDSSPSKPFEIPLSNNDLVKIQDTSDKCIAQQESADDIAELEEGHRTPPLYHEIFLRNRDEYNRPSTGDCDDKREYYESNNETVDRLADSELDQLAKDSLLVNNVIEDEDNFRVAERDIKIQDNENSSSLDYKAKYEEIVRKNAEIHESLIKQQELFEKDRQTMRQEFEIERERIEQEAIRHFVEKYNIDLSKIQFKQLFIKERDHLQEKQNHTSSKRNVIEGNELDNERISGKVDNKECEAQIVMDDFQELEVECFKKRDENHNLAIDISDDLYDRGTVLEFAPINILGNTSKIRLDQERRVQKLDQLRRQKMLEKQERKQQWQQQKSKLTNRSNKQLIKNALQYVCLQGKVNDFKKQQVLQVLKMHKGEHYVIQLLDDKNSNFKSLYSFANNVLTKLTGEGPFVVTFDMIDLYLRYDSASKQFNILQTKDFLLTTDAIVILPNAGRKKVTVKTRTNS